MEKFYIITVKKDGEKREFYFKDMAMAIIQFREFMQQDWLEDKIEWDLPVVFDYGDGEQLALREQEWDDDKLYHL